MQQKDLIINFLNHLECKIMGFQPFNGKGPHPLLWAGSHAAH